MDYYSANAQANGLSENCIHILFLTKIHKRSNVEGLPSRSVAIPNDIGIDAAVFLYRSWECINNNLYCISVFRHEGYNTHVCIKALNTLP